MKLTKSKLREIIREEIQKLNESKIPPKFVFNKIKALQKKGMSANDISKKLEMHIDTVLPIYYTDNYRDLK